MSVLNVAADQGGKTYYLFWCPGCEDAHQITSDWEFNGDLDKPTFSPSYVTWIDPNPNANPDYKGGKYFNGFRCHSFIKEGRIEYLSDCTHKLAGQIVDLPDWSEHGKITETD